MNARAQERNSGVPTGIVVGHVSMCIVLDHSFVLRRIDTPDDDLAKSSFAKAHAVKILGSGPMMGRPEMRPQLQACFASIGLLTRDSKYIVFSR